jgi:hypothetical protein
MSVGKKENKEETAARWRVLVWEHENVGDGQGRTTATLSIWREREKTNILCC